jgi:hypothetical protein
MRYSARGAVSVGVIPVPMYPPMSFSKFEAYREDAANILRGAGARALLMPRSLADLLAPLLQAVEGLQAVSEEFFAEPPEGSASAPQTEAILPEDVMFFQYGPAADAEVLPAPHPLKRQMADLMGRLHADSRFQAGVRAARRGWL